MYVAGPRVYDSVAVSVLRCLGTGHPLIHIGTGARNAFHYEPIQLLHGKPAVFDEPIDPPVEMTPTGKQPLERIQDILPLGDLWIIALAMLQKDKLSTGLQDPSNLAERSKGVADRTECPGTHCTIEPLVFPGERFRPIPKNFDRHGQIDAAFRHALGQQMTRLNGGQPCNRVRIMGEIQSCAEADLEHFSKDLRECLLPLFLKARSSHDSIHEAREYMIGVKTHGIPSDGITWTFAGLIPQLLHSGLRNHESWNLHWLKPDAVTQLLA